MLALLLGVFAALLVTPARGDAIVEWNVKADAIATEKRTATPTHGRGLAMLHVAMFEAVNAIERRYAPYRLNLMADRNTSKEAAAAAAGHDVLLSLNPDQKCGPRRDLGEAVGRPPGWGRPRQKALRSARSGRRDHRLAGERRKRRSGKLPSDTPRGLCADRHRHQLHGRRVTRRG